MAGMTWARILVLVLCFSSIICKNGAIPFTRSRNLMQKPQSFEVIPTRAISGYFEKRWKKMGIRNTRRLMGIALNDYPGSGANNRHTPRPHEPGRGCPEC